MNGRERLGRNVRRLRVAAGLSQEALAADTKLGASHLSRIERGLSNPTFDVLARLAETLRVDLEALISSVEIDEDPIKNMKRGRKHKLRSPCRPVPSSKP